MDTQKNLVIITGPSGSINNGMVLLDVSQESDLHCKMYFYPFLGENVVKILNKNKNDIIDLVKEIRRICKIKKKQIISILFCPAQQITTTGTPIYLTSETNKETKLGEYSIRIKVWCSKNTNSQNYVSDMDDLEFTSEYKKRTECGVIGKKISCCVLMLYFPSIMRRFTGYTGYTTLDGPEFHAVKTSNQYHFVTNAMVTLHEEKKN